MEYRLTLRTVVIGSLAFSLSILVTAWVLDWVGRHRGRAGYRTGRSDDEPGGAGGRSYDRETRLGPRIYPVGAFDESRSSDIELGRVRRDETRLTPRRRAG